MLIKLAAYLIALSRYIADEVEELHNERRKHVLSLHGSDIDAARSKYNKRVAKIHSKLAGRSQRAVELYAKQQAAQASRDKADRLLDALK